MSTIHLCWRNQHQEAVDSTLSQMLEASSYWSPDATCKWEDNEAGVGLARAALFNCPGSEKEQVFVDASSALAIAANARLDNRVALAEQLPISPPALEDMPDSRLILASYKLWGTDCVKHLKGDFAFIIWDGQQKKIFCARDHFGVKSLFWSKTPHGILISNEHNAFFTSEWLDASDVSEEWLVRQLWGLGAQKVTSPHPDIHLLPPAHMLEIDAKGCRITEYWTLEQHQLEQTSDDELLATFKHLFDRAVARRLSSRYPLASELSEGLDSSGIAGTAARMLGDDVLYTLSYQCERLDDENKAIWQDTYQDIEDFIALHSNIQPVWVEIADGDDWLIRQSESFQKAFGSLYPYLGFHCYRAHLASKKGARVLLSGWGGDHCVTNPGDEYEHELFRQGRWRQLFRLLKAKQKRSRCRNVPKRFLGITSDNILPVARHYLSLYRQSFNRTQSEQLNSHILSDHLLGKYKMRQELQTFLKSYQRLSVAAKERRELFELGMCNRLLDSELTARCFRMEYRYPMLDVDLVTFAHSLPSHLKSYEGIERYPIRKSIENVVTPRIQWRIKSDVSTPNIDRGSAAKAYKKSISSYVDELSRLSYLFETHKINTFLHGNYNQAQLKRMLSVVRSLAKMERALNIR
jgi:asparagine synthase (glutamine-hydrolysing)